MPVSEFRFYVYLLFRPWNGVPCYVGKGQGKRVHSHGWAGGSHNNKHLGRIIKKAAGPVPFVILMTTDDENEAFAWEVKIIKSLGRRDQGEGPLCNHTDGGEGASGRTGWFHSDASKAKMSASHSGIPKSETHRRNIGRAGIGRKHSIEIKDRIGIANRGKRRTAEQNDANRAAQLGTHRSDACKNKQSETMRGRRHTPEAIENMRGRKDSPETIAKRVATRARNALMKKKEPKDD